MAETQEFACREIAAPMCKRAAVLAVAAQLSSWHCGEEDTSCCAVPPSGLCLLCSALRCEAAWQLPPASACMVTGTMPLHLQRCPVLLAPCAIAWPKLNPTRPCWSDYQQGLKNIPACCCAWQQAAAYSACETA
jgi:hypothetical protein